MFDFLGKISYGIYMYHLMIIPCVLIIIQKFVTPNSNYFLFNVLLYTFTIITTLLVSWLSYNFFESRFINLKDKFTIIHSGKK